MRPHLYRSVIFLSIWVWVWVFKVAPISIGHLPVSLCSVWVFGPHLYRSVVHFVSSVFETAPILIGRFHVSSAFKTTPISIDHSFCQFSFWDHGYIDQSFPCQFSFRTAPISIGHSPCQFSFCDRTYIDQSFPCQFSFWDYTYIDRSLSCQLSWLLFVFESHLPSWVLFDLASHLFLWVHSFWRSIIPYLAYHWAIHCIMV